jgi:hypothetical protein
MWYTQILVGLRWSEEKTEYFLNNSCFCNLNCTMYWDYLGLLGELIRMNTMFGNNHPVQSALDWYTMCFRMNRTTATTHTLAAEVATTPAPTLREPDKF